MVPDAKDVEGKQGASDTDHPTDDTCKPVGSKIVSGSVTAEKSKISKFKLMLSFR